MKHLKEFRDHFGQVPADGETYQIGNKSLYVMRVNGAYIWTSYQTIIAVWCKGYLYETDQRHSVTTTRHVSLIRLKGPMYRERVTKTPRELADMALDASGDFKVTIHN